MSAGKKFLLVGAIAAFVFAADQYTKSLVVQRIVEHQAISIIPNFFDLTLRYNTGAAFSLFSTMSLAYFLGISALAIGMLIFFVYQLEEEKRRQYLALGAILGGAVGNLCDRVRIGGVVDFLLFYYKSFSWPAFNVADIAIVCGVFVFLLENLKLTNLRKSED